MKVYPDSNIYLTYLLGERAEHLSRNFFTKSLECKYRIMASAVVFREIDRRLGNQARMLLECCFKDFRRAKKMDVALFSLEDVHWAAEQNIKTGHQLGESDWLHILVASKNADILVTNDRKMLRESKPFIRALDLSSFLDQPL